MSLREIREDVDKARKRWNDAIDRQTARLKPNEGICICENCTNVFIVVERTRASLLARKWFCSCSPNTAIKLITSSKFTEVVSFDIEIVPGIGSRDVVAAPGPKIEIIAKPETKK